MDVSCLSHACGLRVADDLIDLAFSKKRADDRKDWLKAYEPGTHVDYDTDTMLVSEFIQKELILFSMADNVRSIPSVVSASTALQVNAVDT